MSDHFPSSSLWEQHYRESILMDDLAIPCPEFSDATVVSTTDFDINETLFSPNYSAVLSSNSPENPSSSAGSDLKPKTSTVTPKRRRSRASKLTPTTFLNAHITNFRALVQKHTGSSHAEKGPITLCFGSSPSSSATDHQQINGLISTRKNPLEVVSGRSYQAQDQQYFYNHQHQQFQRQDPF